MNKSQIWLPKTALSPAAKRELSFVFPFLFTHRSEQQEERNTTKKLWRANTRGKHKGTTSCSSTKHKVQHGTHLMNTLTRPAHTAETATASTLSTWMTRWTNVQTARIHQRHFVSNYPVTLKKVQGHMDECATLARIFQRSPSQHLSRRQQHYEFCTHKRIAKVK